MKVKILCLLFLVLVIPLKASEHGIYLMTNQKVKGEVEQIQKQIVDALKKNNFNILASLNIHTPDYVRKDKSEHCGLKAHLIVFSSNSYQKMLTSYGTKYLVAGFLRVGIYETPKGINVIILDPETINRIVFNDLYENDKRAEYQQVVTKTKSYKKIIIDLLHQTIGGKHVKTNMPPIRENDDLAESSKDMFMMVGALTLFNDEDQFPRIYSMENPNGIAGLKELENKFRANLKSFNPVKDDKDYRWYPNENALKWKIISKITSPDNNAILLGITRPRTEAVSFNIAGSSREDDSNKCPGIDHVPAYPIEVLLIQEGNKINVYTQREMHRMDMYFWDAGMSAFMNHMSMPAVLDESIKKALLGNEYTED